MNSDLKKQHKKINIKKYLKPMLIFTVIFVFIVLFFCLFSQYKRSFIGLSNSNLNYYIFESILSNLSIFVSDKYLSLFNFLLIFIRLYLSGISFLVYCKHKKLNCFSSVIGMLVYVFSAFSLYATVAHPFLINMMILFPLLITATDRFINRNKKYFYVLMVFITCITNIFLAYNMFIILGLYSLILIIRKNKKNLKKIFKSLVKIIIYSIIGIALSACITLPAISTLLDLIRSGIGEIPSYTSGYYQNLFSSMIAPTPSYGICMGVQSIILLAFPIFIKNYKKQYTIFLTMLFLIIPLLFSKIGSIFFNFGLPIKSWTFIYGFFNSYIIAWYMNKKNVITIKEFEWFLVFIILFVASLFVFDNKIDINMSIQMVLLVGYLFMFIYKPKKIYKIILTVLLVLGICTNIYNMYGKKGTNTLTGVNFKLDSYNKESIVGKINLDEAGIIQFTTNCSKCWKVYIDNQKQDTLKSNKYFLEVFVKEGEHKVELISENLWLKEGTIITIGSITLFGTLEIIRYIIVKRKKTEKKTMNEEVKE